MNQILFPNKNLLNKSCRKEEEEEEEKKLIVKKKRKNNAWTIILHQNTNIVSDKYIGSNVIQGFTEISTQISKALVC